MIKLEMVSDNLLIQVDIPDTETEGGIIVSEETAREAQQDIRGEIKLVGPDVKAFKSGDIVLLPPHGSTPAVYNGVVYHVFKEYSLFAKIVE